MREREREREREKYIAWSGACLLTSMKGGYALNKEESDVQMALRLMRTLDYHQEMRSLKRSYVLERWPENSKKHKTLGFVTENCVPECDVREEKDIFVIKSLVEESVETLCGSGQKNNDSSKSDVLGCSLEPFVGRVEEISDLELVKRAPSMLCSLNKKALKILLYTLTGKQLTSNHRYIFEREIETEFVKLILPSSKEGLPESLLKVASVIRDPSSYRHTLGSINPHANLFSAMPLSALAAAREAFTRVGNFPTRIVMEVGKLLILEDSKNSPLSFRHKTHLKTVEAVNKEVERRLEHLKEGDLLPACLEGALQVISLSARILFGHDSGLVGLLKPSSPEKLALEKDFQAAYSQIEKMDIEGLAKICNTLSEGPEKPKKKKQVYVDELQRILIDSMHCIYAFGGFPEHVTKAILMINDTSHPATKEVKMESNHGNDRVQETAPIHRLSKEGKRHERIMAEIDSVLDVSAQFRSAVWECYESFLEATDEQNISRAVDNAEPSSMKLDSTEAILNSTSSTCYPEVDTTSSERNQPAVKIEMEALENEQPKKSAAPDCSARRQERVHQDLGHLVQDVEAFSDEAAAIVYVLIGCLLKDVLVQHSLFLDTTAVDYLQTGLDKLQPSSVLPRTSTGAKILPTSSESLDADELVLGIAKNLNSIPQRVILEAERQLRHGCK